MVRMNMLRKVVKSRHPAAGLAITAIAYAGLCSVGGATQSDEDQIPQITVRAHQKSDYEASGGFLTQEFRSRRYS
jgi:hypothetical protein